MTMPTFGFTPSNGWNDPATFPDNPSASQVRPMFQLLFDQLKTYLNTTYNSAVDAEISQAVAGVSAGVSPYANRYADDTGTANTYVCNFGTPFTLVKGMILSFKATHANTGASTLNANSGGAIAIRTTSGNALVGGEISLNGMIVVEYDGTYYQLIASYTASEILAKLLTVDGAGSGLDADMLDAKHASDFLSSNSVGDTIILSDTTAKNILQGGYVLSKSYRLGNPATSLRISFKLIGGGAPQYTYAKIYRNGVAIGTERSTQSTSGTTFTEDISAAWAVGDLVQIYTYKNDVYASSVTNVTIGVDKSPIVNVITA